MPSQPHDSGWNFSSVFDLIDSDVHSISSPTLTPRTRPSASALLDNYGGIRLGSFATLYKNLGLPQDAPSPLPPLDPESELSNSDDALLPSPVLEPTKVQKKTTNNPTEQPLFDSGLSKKQRQKARKRAEKERLEEAANDVEQKAKLRKQPEILAEPATKKEKPTQIPVTPSRAQSRSNVGVKIRPSSPSPAVATKQPVMPKVQQNDVQTPKVARPTVVKRSSTNQPTTPQPIQHNDAPSIVEAVSKVAQITTPTKPALLPQPSAPQFTAPLQSFQSATPIGQGQGLVPRTVHPVTLPRRLHPVVPQVSTTPTPIVQAVPRYALPATQPSSLTIRSQVDRHFHLFNKLLNDFPEDRRWLISPMQLISERTCAHGLHVFVDASNIMIGFKDMLRNHGIPPYQYDISFDSLALLMERRRPVAKRFFAGSHREANPLPHITKLVDTSKAIGYDSVMQEQVLIVREDSEKKKFFNDVKKLGWHKANQLRSGSGSDSETGSSAPKTPSPPKWVEQGVDEILHLKMCQSIIDTEVPSTMVLATGDGAVAEMSDGFLAHVERALKKGWKVELVSWGQQTNGGYKNRKFRSKWGEQFQIIELDEFLEDLIDTP